MSHYTGAVPDTRRRTDWRDNAACTGMDAELFFALPTTARGAHDAEEAKAACRHCPSQDACLQFALDNNIGYGIFGGLTEDERTALRRSTVRGRLTPEEAAKKAEKARQPKQPRTLQSIYDDNTKALHAHIVWTGPDKINFEGAALTPKRLAFILDRGHAPEGRVTADCGVSTCVLPVHLVDDTERARCGTRPGYQQHRARGEEACDPCKRANADADNRLRWTGTTKAAA